MPRNELCEYASLASAGVPALRPNHSQPQLALPPAASSSRRTPRRPPPASQHSSGTRRPRQQAGRREPSAPPGPAGRLCGHRGAKPAPPLCGPCPRQWTAASGTSWCMDLRLHQRTLAHLVSLFRPLAKGTQQVVVVAGHPHEEALTQWQVRWQQHEPSREQHFSADTHRHSELSRLHQAPPPQPVRNAIVQEPTQPPHADLALRRVRIVQQLVGPVMARSESFHLEHRLAMATEQA
mmetsp:Transcript_133891/g.317413  ORF Transcript_133891/g.317413 Transcript_133891/m.317413 type:complete len:237 (-) Transcript_133891:25-735(-)